MEKWAQKNVWDIKGYFIKKDIHCMMNLWKMVDFSFLETPGGGRDGMEGLRPKNQQKQQTTFQVIQILSTRGRTLTLSCISLVQFSSVAQSCPTLCDPMNRSMPGLPVHHQLLEFTQTRVHRVSDAIQPSHPWSSPSPPAPNPSQHQSLFQWVNSSHEVAKVLEFQL